MFIYEMEFNINMLGMPMMLAGGAIGNRPTVVSIDGDWNRYG